VSHRLQPKADGGFAVFTVKQLDEIFGVCRKDA
jgi:hypothetical protein